MNEDIPVVADADSPLTDWSTIAACVEQGDTVPFIAQGSTIGYILPASELERLRETIAVLADPETIADLLLNHNDPHQLEGTAALNQLLAHRRTQQNH